MTVQDLISELHRAIDKGSIQATAKVILSIDEEGNGFHELYCLGSDTGLPDRVYLWPGGRSLDE